jgi:hypothetical protein
MNHCNEQRQAQHRPLNTSSDDDGEKSAARKDTRNMDSFTVSDCDKYSTLKNHSEDNNGRSADGFTTATDYGACVIRDSGGWITVEKKRRSKDRTLTSNSELKFDTHIGVTSMILRKTVHAQP